jgi:hypothetical protein
MLHCYEKGFREIKLAGKLDSNLYLKKCNMIYISKLLEDTTKGIFLSNNSNSYKSFLITVPNEGGKYIKTSSLKTV